uniref:Ladybird homeobox 2 n=1 Tax=Myotis myotis TaxID=51298 RepID=A0A7J7U543_MYOMY|nr:ladybird homeobox 2 [Myotis myotis]
MSSGPEPRTARTPFSIADILGPGMAPRGPSAPQLPESSPGPTSPLCALEELTSNAFRGLDGLALQRSEGGAVATERPGRGDKRPEPEAVKQPRGPRRSGPRPRGPQTAQVPHGVHGAAGAGAGAALRVAEVPGAPRAGRAGGEARPGQRAGRHVVPEPARQAQARRGGDARRCGLAARVEPRSPGPPRAARQRPRSQSWPRPGPGAAGLRAPPVGRGDTGGRLKAKPPPSLRSGDF